MQEKVISIKITLLGNYGVGKSSIIFRYKNGSFEEDYYSTNGISYSDKIINRDDINYQLDIWDTAGQEKYNSLGRNFYREAYVVILVYDITKKDSLEGLKNIWYPDLLKYGEKYKILTVVGNKSDRYREENTVSEEEARKFAYDIKANFMIVSAKTGDNIQNLFENLVDLYSQPNFQEQIVEEENKRKGSYKIQKKKKEEKDLKEKEKKCC